MAKSNITINQKKKSVRRINQDYNKLINFGIIDVKKNNFNGAIKKFS